MTEAWTPELRLRTSADRCQLRLVGVTYGNGATMQEASNDMLARLFDLAMTVRDGRYRPMSELGAPDPRVLSFLYEIGEIAANGGDIRQRVFDVPAPRHSTE
ncbi:MAG TPA: hypothetical protein VKB59_08475 [Micromonosporaceae bacterium]|jgi:hypothetical protein|nr:hypothetical protein [Micromonosporaceae bacterium]HKE64672.1 hypothetical protein [Micromonosporaceae bacterium]